MVGETVMAQRRPPGDCRGNDEVGGDDERMDRVLREFRSSDGVEPALHTLYPLCPTELMNYEVRGSSTQPRLCCDGSKVICREDAAPLCG